MKAILDGSQNGGQLQPQKAQMYDTSENGGQGSYRQKYGELDAYTSEFTRAQTSKSSADDGTTFANSFDEQFVLQQHEILSQIEFAKHQGETQTTKESSGSLEPPSFSPMSSSSFEYQYADGRYRGRGDSTASRITQGSATTKTTASFSTLSSTSFSQSSFPSSTKLYHDEPSCNSMNRRNCSPPFRFHSPHDPSSSSTTPSISSFARQKSTGDGLLEYTGSYDEDRINQMMHHDDVEDSMDGGLTAYLRDAKLIRDQAWILEQIQLAASSNASSAGPQLTTHGNSVTTASSSPARPHPMIERGGDEESPWSSINRPTDSAGPPAHSLREYVQDANARMKEQTSRFASVGGNILYLDKDDGGRHPPVLSHDRYCVRQHPGASHGVESSVASAGLYVPREERKESPRASPARATADASATPAMIEDGASATAPAATIDPHLRVAMTDDKRSRFSGSCDGTGKASSCSRNSPSNWARSNGIVTQDKVIPVGTNKTLRVRGTEQTYDAIARGEAVIVQCPACRAILQIAASADLLYCVLCESVTPVEWAREQAVVNPTVLTVASRGADASSSTDGDAMSHSSSMLMLDYQTAQAIQNQEWDIACARKLATMRQRDHGLMVNQGS